MTDKDRQSDIQPKSVKTNYVLSMAYEVFSLITPLITAPYISRVLGAEGVGIYSYTDSIVQYFILFGNLGVATYGQMAIAGCRDDAEKRSKTFVELWTIRFCTMVISYVVYMIATFSFSSYREAMLIQGILILAAALDLTWLFRGIENFSMIVIRNFLIRILVVVLVFVLVKDENDVNVYILLVVLSTLLGNITFLFSLPKIIRHVDFRTLNIVQHLKPCLVFFIPTIATSVYKLLDKTMLGILTEGTSQNGYYEQAHKIEQMLIVVITSLNTIMRSRMSALFKQGRIQAMHEYLDRSLSYILLVAVPMTAGLVAIAPNFIPIFLGDGFEESIILLQIFAFLLIFIGLSNCLNTHYLGPCGLQGKSNFVLIFGALINFVFNAVSIPRLGAVGAAIASVLAEAIILIGYLMLSRKFVRVSHIIKLGWKYIIAGVVMFVLVYLVGKLDYSMWILLILQVIVGVAVYAAVVLVLRDSFALYWLKAAPSIIKKKFSLKGK